MTVWKEKKTPVERDRPGGKIIKNSMHVEMRLWEQLGLGLTKGAVERREDGREGRETNGEGGARRRRRSSTDSSMEPNT